MNDRILSSNGRWRRVLIASAIIGLVAIGISHLDRRTAKEFQQPAQRVRLSEAVREAPALSPAVGRSGAAFDEKTVGQGRHTAAELAYVPRPAMLQSTPLPFKLLGKVQEGDAATLLLYRGGYLLAIRDGTPADDDYVVDAQTDDYVVLRQRSTNESQIIQLAARQEAVVSEWNDTAPD